MQTTPRRRLPHVYPEAQSLFVTWHLHGSLPASRYPPPGKLSSRRAFVWIGHYLYSCPVVADASSPAGKGLTLRQPEIARLVVVSIHAYAVMSNHVHLLFHPKIHPSQLLKSLKGASKRQANQLLGRTREPFWQKESYDRWVRNDSEFERISRNNPVKAGLAGAAGEYLWSSAGVEKNLDAARTSAYATLG